MKDWTLLQVEGEEAVPIAEVSVAVDPKLKKLPTKAVKQVEEVIDNRPRTVQFKKDTPEGDGLRFSE